MLESTLMNEWKIITPWFAEQQQWHLPRDPKLHEWLFWRESMTLKIQDALHDKLAVKVLTQEWQKPQPDEAELLQIDVQQLCLIREVELSAAKKYVVFARSVMPSGPLTRQYETVNGLKQKPIGEWLFSDPDLQRSSFEFCKLHKNGSDEVLWARRSILVGHGQQLLLTEVFMPSLYDH